MKLGEKSTLFSEGAQRQTGALPQSFDHQTNTDFDPFQDCPRIRLAFAPLLILNTQLHMARRQDCLMTAEPPTKGLFDSEQPGNLAKNREPPRGARRGISGNSNARRTNPTTMRPLSARLPLFSLAKNLKRYAVEPVATWRHLPLTRWDKQGYVQRRALYEEEGPGFAPEGPNARFSLEKEADCVGSLS